MTEIATAVVSTTTTAPRASIAQAGVDLVPTRVSAYQFVGSWRAISAFTSTSVSFAVIGRTKPASAAAGHALTLVAPMNTASVKRQTVNENGTKGSLAWRSPV